MKTFGEIEKELRLKHGYTIDEVAEGTHISKGAISRYESGTREPAFHLIKYFCEFYGVSADYLLGLVDEPHAKYGEVYNPAIIPTPVPGRRKVKARAAKFKDKRGKIGGAS